MTATQDPPGQSDPPGAVEERFHLLVEGVQEYAIYLLDPAGVVQTWNAGARRIKGYEEEEIVGRHFSVFFTDDDVSAGKPQRLLADAVAEGRAVDEGWRVRRDGARFWANVVITALFDEQGTIRGFAKVTRDDTDRRAAQQTAHDLELFRELERIATAVNESVITRLFAAGLALEGLRSLSKDPRHTARIDSAVDELDHALRDLRDIMFDNFAASAQYVTGEPPHAHRSPHPSGFDDPLDRRVFDSLTMDFGGRVAPDRIAAAITGARRRLADARIVAYLPVLLERCARDLVRRPHAEHELA